MLSNHEPKQTLPPLSAFAKCFATATKPKELTEHPSAMLAKYSCQHRAWLGLQQNHVSYDSFFHFSHIAVAISGRYNRRDKRYTVAIIREFWCMTVVSGTQFMPYKRSHITADQKQDWARARESQRPSRDLCANGGHFRCKPRGSSLDEA